MNGASCSCLDRSALHKAFGLAFRTRIKKRVNSVGLVYCVCDIVHENRTRLNHNTWRNKTSD